MTDEIPIGPNSCCACGGEYGEHDEDCRLKPRADPTAAPVFPHSTVELPDGVVLGGQWPNVIVAWPGGKSRSATKPEYDLFQALEKAHVEIDNLRKALEKARAEGRGE